MENSLMPVVHEDIRRVVEAEMEEKGGNQYIKEVLLRLAEENPWIADFISKFAATTKDPTSIAYCGVLVYRLLESQAGADQLKEAICP